MKHRPTEIPYIPKDARRSRLAPREGGKILARNKGIEALRRTDGRARGGGTKNWLPFALFAGVFVYSMMNDFFDADPSEEPAPPVRTETIPITDIVPRAPETPPEGAARMPRGDVRGVFTSDDYPLESLRREEEGTVRARLTIDESGAPTGCEIVQSSGFARLDDMTCRLIFQRAQFEPALDESGVAVEGTYTTPPIRWEIPRR